MRTYIATARTLRQITTRKHQRNIDVKIAVNSNRRPIDETPRCEHCHMLLREGDVIVSKRKRIMSAQYHYNCAIKINIVTKKPKL